jgi:uncharacterized protein (TIGR02117 family)
MAGGKNNILKYFFKKIFLLFLFIILYVIASLIISLIPYRFENTQKEKNINLYLESNGIHTDLILPYENEIYSWNHFFSELEIQDKSIKPKFISFGWGDRGFYLEALEWKDLKLKIAFKALFYMSSSVMHIQFIEKINNHSNLLQLKVKEENYKKLIRFIQNSFQTQNAKIIPIKGFHYDTNDSFYEAKGRYSLFYTCNTWINQALRESELDSCLWTILDACFFTIYKK